MNAIKRCPFCNGEAKLRELIDGAYVVECYNCRLDMGEFETEEEAVNAWNRRTDSNDAVQRTHDEEVMSDWWIFTFGGGQENEGYYVRVWGTYGTARQKMINKYGLKWAFQYSLKEWVKMERDPHRFYPMETLLEVIQ